jgi:hypothetical protein
MEISSPTDSSPKAFVTGLSAGRRRCRTSVTNSSGTSGSASAA